ncbi:hypothetical protein FEDK69T_29410 [Flavobacterium enshiense DK69]|nr:hypothetical protein FEDK69T_29410 [Flavobacterium enshiense DK69]
MSDFTTFCLDLTSKKKETSHFVLILTLEHKLSIAMQS